MKERSPAINLLPRDPFYETPAGKLLSWGTNVGKYVLMFTQLVVLVSFAARFTLDRQLTDLNTSILQHAALVDSYGQLEEDVREIQTKTAFIKQYAGQQHAGDYLLALSTITPVGVKLSNIQFGTQQIGIAGIAQDTTSLSQFIVNMQAVPEFANISVGDIKNSDSNEFGLKFGITISLIPPGSQKK